MPGLTEMLAEAERRLAQAGVASPRLDARLLAAAALGADPSAVALRQVEPDEASAGRFAELVERRAAREPVSRILGRREFWSLDFALGPDTLDPRPDSEILVQAVLDRLPAGPVRLLDLGTGTGCLLAALLSERPDASGLGIDIAPGAVARARANLGALGLGQRAEVVEGSWLSGIAGPFDAVLSNPPYIPTADLATLEPELAFDPGRALDGGADGLDCYRTILLDAARVLAPGGLIAFEIGHDQGAEVAALLERSGFEGIAILPDLERRDRVVLGYAQKILGKATPSD